MRVSDPKIGDLSGVFTRLVLHAVQSFDHAHDFARISTSLLLRDVLLGAPATVWVSLVPEKALESLQHGSDATRMCAAQRMSAAMSRRGGTTYTSAVINSAVLGCKYIKYE
jgi:hypothetical protein